MELSGSHRNLPQRVVIVYADGGRRTPLRTGIKIAQQFNKKIRLAFQGSSRCGRERAIRKP